MTFICTNSGPCQQEKYWTGALKHAIFGPPSVAGYIYYPGKRSLPGLGPMGHNDVYVHQHRAMSIGKVLDRDLEIFRALQVVNNWYR